MIEQAKAAVEGWLQEAGSAVVEDACTRIPITRDVVGPDGTITDATIGAQIATAVATLVWHAGTRDADEPR